MKDKQTREKLYLIEHEIVRMKEKTELIINSVSAWQDGLKWANKISIENCPKCKHPTLVQFIEVGEYYQCLFCGTKFTCSKEDVCKIIEEEK